MKYFCKESYEGVEFYGKWEEPKDKNGYFNFINASKEEVDEAVSNGTGVLFESREELKQKLQYWFYRRDAYPSIESQMDTLFNKGEDAWRLEIQTIKNRFPKPDIITS